ANIGAIAGDRVRERAAHGWYSSLMQHTIYTRHGGGARLRVADVGFHPLDAVFDFSEPALLSRGEIVYDPDRMPLGEEPADQMRSNESGSTGNEHLHQAIPILLIRIASCLACRTS